MKMLKHITAFLLVAGLGFALAGCPQPDGAGSGGGDVSFDSFTPPSVWVENLTNEKLVAFKGSVSPNTLISGIPAFSGQHGLKKDSALFGSNQAFVLLMVRESDYNANKSNLGAAPVFSRIYAFYNHTATNNNVFEISSKIGGEGRLTISNPLSYNVEIRSGGPTGQILGYAAARMTQGNIVYVNAPETYDIYPVFALFNPIDQELYKVTPKYTGGNLAGKPYMIRLGFGGSDMTHTLNLQDIEDQGDFGLSTGSAYLRIINNTRTAVTFRNGTTDMITSIGVPAINASRSENFALSFGLSNVDGSYPENQTFSQLIIDPGQRTLTIPSQSYELDYMYTIEITGNTASDMKLESVVKGEKVDLDKIFGLNR